MAPASSPTTLPAVACAAVRSLPAAGSRKPLASSQKATSWVTGCGKPVAAVLLTSVSSQQESEGFFACQNIAN